MTQQFNSWVPIQYTKHTDSKRYMHPSTHSSIVNNCQVMEAILVSTNRWMGKRRCGIYGQWNIASCAQLCLTLCNPMDCIAHQALSIGFCRQEYWGGLPFPPLGDLSDPGTEPMSPALAGRFFTTTNTWEAPMKYYSVIKENEMLPFVTT